MRVSVASLLDSRKGKSDINVCMWEFSNGSQIQHASYQFPWHEQHGFTSSALKVTKKKILRAQLRALVCKNQTNSKFRGKGEKFDFSLILILDRLDYN